MDPDDRARIGFGQLLFTSVQLAMVLAVALLYRLEIERGFGVVAWIILGGFVVHSLLPRRHRLPFFLVLTLIAIGILLRADGLWLVGIGLGLVGLCHLPIRWSWRVALVVLSAGLLAALRASWIEAGWASTVIPVLAAMFMFRLGLYLYDLKDDPTPARLPQRLGYFFLLPNVCFPLFPVVDYKTFVGTYYDTEAFEIYQKGIWWMTVGVGHLLLYRVVYYLMPRADTQLDGIMAVAVFMGMTYGLYLRVSGLFHLIVGSLCLFGFNLPRTNNNYYLASSFSDLWRRINIYWKDFMMTMVFYPIYLGARRRSIGIRIAIATGIVFVLTWALHSYQWFWLQGTFPIVATDILFWGVLGCALVANSLWEIQNPARTIRGRDWRWSRAFSRTARIMGVFLTMAALWSLWYSESVANWWYMLLRIRESRLQDWLLFAGCIAGTLGGGTLAQWLGAKLEALNAASLRRRASVAFPVATCAVLLLGVSFAAKEPEGVAGRLVTKLQSTHLNRIDRERQERGYYEVLSRSNALAVGAVGVDPLEPEAGFLQSEAVRETSDVRGQEIVPGARFEMWNTTFSANKWGMRDREYAQKPPENTYRIALIGSSQAMGYGIGDDETFENLVEDRLNAELEPRSGARYEILNFSVAGYGVPQALYVAEHIAPAFEPDIMVYVVHPYEAGRLTDRLSKVMRRGGRIGDDYGFLQDALEKADAHKGLPAREFQRRLRPYSEELVRLGYFRMAAAIREQGARPVMMFLRLTEAEFDPEERAELMRSGTAAGFLILSLDGVYAGHQWEQIRYDRTDNHPNALGHRLIAASLYSVLIENAEQLGLPTGP